MLGDIAVYSGGARDTLATEKHSIASHCCHLGPDHGSGQIGSMGRNIARKLKRACSLGVLGSLETGSLGRQIQCQGKGTMYSKVERGW